MKERAYPVYQVNKHAEGLLVGGHPWVYENDITTAPETLPENGTLADVEMCIRDRMTSYTCWPR